MPREAKERHFSCGCQGERSSTKLDFAAGSQGVRHEIGCIKPVTEQCALITDTIHLPSVRLISDQVCSDFAESPSLSDPEGAPSPFPLIHLLYLSICGRGEEILDPPSALACSRRRRGRKPGLIEDEEKKEKKQEQLLLKAKNQRKEGGMAE